MEPELTRNVHRLVLWLTIVLASAALIPTSVLLLSLVEKYFQVDWARLSDIGQALGIASALLSGGALIAVVVSIRLQAQQTQVMQFQSVRAMRMELLRTAMDNEAYLPVWGYGPWISSEEIKKRAYFSSVFSYLQISFGLGAIPENELRLDLARSFTNREVRDAWREIRGSYAVEGWPAEFRRFAQIVDETCQHADEIAESSPDEDSTAPDRS